MKENSIYHKAIVTFGIPQQTIVAIEELSELQKELCKFSRGKINLESIAEEMADVYIMLDQMSIIFGNRNKVLKYRQNKLERLKGVIEEELGKNK